jgi:post-segregation antitoxin (ccd killing protein)
LENKGYVTTYVDKKIVEKAKESDFKTSKICENALKEAIRE